MKFKTGLILSFLFFYFTAAAYAGTSLKAEVDKASITTDETITYKLTVNSSESRLPVPLVPKFEGFTVLSSAQSSQISVSQGSLKTLAVYEFILYPQEAGKFKIGPSQIKLKEKSYSSEAFEIEVKQGKNKPKPKPKAQDKPAQPEGPLPESESPKVTL